MKITYTASLSPSCVLGASFNSVKGDSVVGVNVANLGFSTVNYPTGSQAPNAENQVIFKNVPVSWWMDGLNAGNIQYRPVSGLVNWTFIDSQKNEIHIAKEITDVIIPGRTEKVEMIDNTPFNTKVKMLDNNVMLLTKVVMMT
jgi:hypothetical protein